MKTLNLVILVMLLAVTATAQQSNVHVAGVVAGSDGFDFPIVGATVGADVAGDRFVFSVDGAALLRAHKSTYNDGKQFDGRATLRGYTPNGRFFIQGGVHASYLKFDQFNKHVIAPLVGVGVKSDNQLFGANYRHDLTSENKQRIVEGWWQAFGKHRLYGRLAGGLNSYMDSGRRHNGLFVRAEIGFWFR